MATQGGGEVGYTTYAWARRYARLDRIPRPLRRLAGRLTIAGKLHIDAGAANALAANRSLLAAGITSHEGSFQRGDAVEILSPEGVSIARGLVSYDSADLARIAGKRSDAIAAILGYAPRSAVVHRDQMVML